MLENHLSILTCPDCNGNLNAVKQGDLIKALLCSKCILLFPVDDDIPIILPRHKRWPAIEWDLISDLSHMDLSDFHMQALSNTAALLSKSVTDFPIEKEEEAFWSQRYEAEKKAGLQKDWRDRIWQREVIISKLLQSTNIEGKTILSIGAGEGQSFRYLLKKHSGFESLYIATDISMSALKLNRARNIHSKSLYILCFADDELPIHSNSVDVILYFGVLHHTVNKSKNILKDSRLLKRMGFIILHEAIYRSTSVLFLALSNTKNQTEYESYLKKENIITVLKKLNAEVVTFQEEGSFLKTFVLNYLRPIVLWNKTVFSIFQKLDQMFIRAAGRIFRGFKGGEILVVAKIVASL